VDLVESTRWPEQRHPWETARAGFFARVLARDVGPAPGELLDVGAGDAWLAAELARRFPSVSRITCWDRAYARGVPAAAAAHRPRLAFTSDRPAARFPLVLLLDVLEHVEDDRAFLAEIAAENLAAGGHVLVSVPAWPRLYSEHDRRLGHHRRYTPASARALLASAGLRIARSGGLFHSLLLARAASLAGGGSGADTGASDVAAWTAPRVVTSVVAGALACDASLSLLTSRLGVAIPGLSFWALCRRP
jgi:SAM-dependent methyltransferase